MMYAVSVAPLPPSLPATTADAVAVGHIMHIMPPSMITRHAVSGKAMSHSAGSTNISAWMSRSHRCHRHGLRSRG